MEDGDGRVRYLAAKLLGESGDSRAVEPLIRIVGTGQTSNDVKALRKLTGQDLEESRDVWLEWWEQNKNRPR